MDLLIATKNIYKVQEITSVLVDLPLRFLSLEDFPNITEVEENGKTHDDNSIKKAVTIARNIGYWTLADDSGLEVEALEGRPGIFSARYASTPEGRIAKVLSELENVPYERRKARFICVVTLSDPEGIYIVKKGICEGRILHYSQGTGGFGYDPIFLIPSLGKSMAELTMKEKNQSSHRGQAISQIKPVLEKIILQEAKSLKNL